MTVGDNGIFTLPATSNLALRHAFRKRLFAALRLPISPVIVDLSNRSTLNHDDIDLLLECAARSVGRDVQLLLVAGSLSNRVILEVTQIASVLPIFNSMAEALASPDSVANQAAGAAAITDSQPLRRA